MLSRTAHMPKFNSFLRQISKSVTYQKQMSRPDEIKTDSTSTTTSDSKPSTSNSTPQHQNQTSRFVKTLSQETKANISEMFKKNPKFKNTNNNNYNRQQQQQPQQSQFNNNNNNNNENNRNGNMKFRNNNFNRFNNTNNALKNNSNITNSTVKNDEFNRFDKLNSKQEIPAEQQSEKSKTDSSSLLKSLPQKTSEEYLKIISCFQNESIQINDLIVLIQKLGDLLDSEPILIDHFKAHPARSDLISKLSKNLDGLQNRIDDMISILNFALKIDIKVNRLESMIDAKVSSLNGDQLISLITLFRSAKVKLVNKFDVSLKYTNYFLKGDPQNIELFSNILVAMKIFNRNVEVISSLDQKILRLSDQLSVKNWIDLLNTKSILRQRNISLLEACAYQLISLDKDQNKLTLENVQQALLSCGILAYMDEKFEAHLLGGLSNLLKSPELLKRKSETETLLSSIINSIGILQIRDKQLLNTLSKYLMTNFERSQKLLTNFVITCGYLNYNPNTEEFKQIIAKLNSSTHDIEEKRDKITFLNYVWSTCLLKSPNNAFIATVLDEAKFYGALLQESNLKSIILKLFNINLYSMLFLDSANKPQLPNNVTAQNYKNILIPDSSPLNKLFSATLASFRPIDKYFKMNLLTSYGVLIDALMVCDKNGNPQLISEKFDQNMKLNIKDDEHVVAFKLIGFKDHTHIEKVPNGPTAFQLNLLDELGYNSITVTHEELNGEKTILNRVKLLKDKIKQLVDRIQTEQ